ncbi:hypothetical protein PJH10_27665 [Mycobacterium kansasii]|uniref:hypothetical protein n=1 Tax=Mycobacterium kansasii TaxID=1768 RepID=UPI0019103CD4|nr:hypothetical protein [Mycobacterium kansasii]
MNAAEDLHVAGYLEAHERVAAGDADSPAEAELWVPADLAGDDRIRWLEGFHSHFEP